MRIKTTFLSLLFVLGLSLTAFSQTEKTLEAGDGFLNDQIVGDTATDGTRTETVYVLRRGAEYLVSGVFENHGWKIHMKAEDGDGDLPIVRVYPDAEGAIPWTMTGLYGDLEIENLYIDCQPSDTEQPPASWPFVSNAEGASVTYEGCVIANAGQGGVGIWGAADSVIINNCEFLNMGNISSLDLGNGRIIDCRSSEINYLALTNNTFVNTVDRILRHRGGSGVLKEVVFDHNTIVNNAAYHGFIELGNVGNSVQITNNLMIDCMGLGADQSDEVRLTELDAHGETDDSGNPLMVWVGSIPNDTTVYTINKNIYSVSDKLQTFYTSEGVDEGPDQILTAHITGKLGDDAATAWVKKDVSLGEVPEAMTELYTWYYSPEGANKQKITTDEVDYDKKSYSYWLNDLDGSYSVTDSDFTGTDDVAVGDPRWGSSVTIPAYEVVLEAGDGFLNDQIVGDTASDGTRIETVYVLRRDAEYLVSGVFENHGWKIHIKAEDGDGALPIVRVYPDAEGAIPWTMTALYGDLEIENLYIDCQPSDTEQPPASWPFVSNAEGASVTYESCVIANAGQGGVGIWGAADSVIINNCQFFNMGNISSLDLGNGRIIDCRSSEINYLAMTNNTFVNTVDRILRHRGGSGVLKEVIFDHNTIVNNAAYHGFIELGNVGNSVQITNNLMIDCMGLGADQSDAVRLTELDAHGETDDSGNPLMVWVGSIPNDTTVYTINKNIYTVSDKLQTFYTSEEVDEGPDQILTAHITGKLGDDAATAWVKKDISLVDAPEAMTELYTWYYSADGANKQKITTDEVDYDKKSYSYWLNDLDCGYEMPDDDLIGTDDIAVGDPRWEATTTGISGISSVKGIELSCYPNPLTQSATVQFNLDQDSDVTINIYDITGRSIRQINAGYYTSGVNNVVINRGNMSRGVYILNIKAGTSNGFMKITVK